MNKKYKNQQKEFIKYLEDEKDRLARECSHIYEDSLGHTRLVNEDISDEINDVLKKYKEIKIFDLAKEIVDILSTMSQEELKCLKLEYDIAFKMVELKKLKNRLDNKYENNK